MKRNLRKRRLKVEDTIQADPEYQPSESSSSYISELSSDIEEVQYENTHEEVRKYPRLESAFAQTLAEISRTEPNIETILNANIRLADRARLLQYYELYKSMPLSEEAFALRDKINEMIKRFTQKDGIPLELSVDNMRERILALPTCQKNKAVMLSKYYQLKETPPSNDEYGKLKAWLNFALTLPFDSLKEIKVDLKKVKDHLDRELSGLTRIKEQLLVFLNARIHNPSLRKCSLGLVGPTGVGKTRLVQVLSEATGYPFVQISFGGVNHPDFLKGHDYTYIGSSAGAIARALARLGCKNGIIFLDEYDKIEGKPQVRDAVLEITDPTQNHDFRDNYVSELSLDLSRIWFFYSMNRVPTGADEEARVDRLYIIPISGYTLPERVQIATEYLLPRTLTNLGLKSTDITINEEAVKWLVIQVSGVGYSGVRQIEYTLNNLVMKLHLLVHNSDLKVSFRQNTKLKYPLTLNKTLVKKLS